MRVESLRFEHHEEGSVPSELTVTMSITEAAQIACLFGEMSHKAMTDRGWPITDIYNDLSNVFSRYWENGVQGAMSQRKER